VTRELRAIQPSDRAPLRRLGVRFGAFSIFLPALVKPAAARLKALLWAVQEGLTEIPPPPAAGLTPSPADPTVRPGFYEAAGFRLCGTRAVRIDMLERLGEIIRAKGKSGQMPETFAASPDMMSVLGCGEEDLTHVLRALGFRDRQVKNEAGEETTEWSLRQRREERRPKPRPQRPKRADVTAAAPYGAPSEAVAATSPRGDSSVPSREHKRKDRKPQRGEEKQRPQRRPEKPHVVDPDSPFAALAALKFRK
jgi:ATP-dependent RNA helicase SUPV3L1/SUV3